MAGVHTPVVLVIDDIYGANLPKGSTGYGRRSFLRDYGNGPYSLNVTSGFDEEKNCYSIQAVEKTITELQGRLDGILLDIRFGNDADTLGLDILKMLQKSYPTLPVVMMTSVPKEELLDLCLKLGAVDYLVKPLQPDILWQTLDRYMGIKPEWWLIGQSKEFSNVVDITAMASEGSATSVLLLGESGTGKELFSRYLHRHGPRKEQPFQAIHLPSLPESLLEGQLFGYRKGAFTGADRDEPGLLCQADGGVLFLDEIGDLGLSIQAKLLRVLETREVPRLGDGKVRKIDIQIVVATNVNLSARVKENLFRLDLYKRLGGMIIRLPSLAERKQDVTLLVRHMLRRIATERTPGQPSPELPVRLEQTLKAHRWDGNVRDIWNYVQRVFDLSRGKELTEDIFFLALDSSDEFLEFSHGAVDQNRAVSVVEFGDFPEIDELPLLPKQLSAQPSGYLEQLALRELSLLFSALEHTRDPVTGDPNRARAAALLKGKRKCSTNEFDRWVLKVSQRLSGGMKMLVTKRYPELVSGIDAKPNKKREKN